MSGTCTCASSGVQEMVVWTAFTSSCHSEGSIFGPKKSRKIRHADTGLPSISHLHGCTLMCLFLLFGGKNREIDHLLLYRSGLLATLSATISEIL